MVYRKLQRYFAASVLYHKPCFNYAGAHAQASNTDGLPLVLRSCAMVYRTFQHEDRCASRLLSRFGSRLYVTAEAVTYNDLLYHHG